MLDPAFVERVNGTLVCLTCAILCHALRAWRTGVFPDSWEFKPDGARGKSLRIMVPGRLTNFARPFHTAEEHMAGVPKANTGPDGEESA
jgi:hypothetical protein